MLLGFDTVHPGNFFTEMKKLADAVAEFCNLPVLFKRQRFVREIGISTRYIVSRY